MKKLHGITGPHRCSGLKQPATGRCAGALTHEKLLSAHAAGLQVLSQCERRAVGRRLVAQLLLQRGYAGLEGCHGGRQRCPAWAQRRSKAAACHHPANHPCTSALQQPDRPQVLVKL